MIPTSSARNPEQGRILGKLALSLGILVVLLFAVEGVVRTRQKLRYGTFGQIYEFAEDPVTGLSVPVAGSSTDSITINSLGFRGPELDPPSDEVLRVAFLGGSTTYCAEASSDEATWPSLVTAHLGEAFPSRGFDYVNAGVGGYTIRQTRENLKHRVAPLEPDVLVLYHATNDLTRNSRQLAQEQGVYKGHADQGSWIGEWSLAWYLVEKNLLQKQRAREARGVEGRLEVDVDALSRPFRQELALLVAEAKEVAPVVCVITFSHRARPEQSPEERFAACNTSLYYMPYMTPEGLLEAFEAYNLVIEEVALESGVLLLDCARSIPGDGEHFNDSVHLTDAGCRAMAQCVAAGLTGDEGFAALATP